MWRDEFNRANVSRLVRNCFVFVLIAKMRYGKLSGMVAYECVSPT